MRAEPTVSMIHWPSQRKVTIQHTLTPSHGKAKEFSRNIDSGHALTLSNYINLTVLVFLLDPHYVYVSTCLSSTIQLHPAEINNSIIRESTICFSSCLAVVYLRAVLYNQTTLVFCARYEQHPNVLAKIKTVYII